MTTVLNESKVEKGPEAGSVCCAACLGEVKHAIERVENGVTKLQAAVAETIDDGKVAAERLLRRSRYAVEDGVDGAVQTIKQHPVSSVAVMFFAGAALGLLMPRFGKK